jgi:hypothetical protein
MRDMKTILLALIIICMSIIGAATHAQNVIPASGGNATGINGSVSFTVGQIVYTTNTGTNGSVAQGVQQPHEISLVTAIENSGDITLESTVYPNPTRGSIKLIVGSSDYENMRFHLYDINGVLLRDKKIEYRETEISMENLSSAAYFLKIIKNNLEVKVFKIVKR